MTYSVLSQLDKRDITASRVAALFDCHPFISRAALAGALRSGGSPARGVAPSSAAALRAGRLLEPAIAQAISEKHPTWRLEKARDYIRLSEYRLGCICDYYIPNRNATLECKSVSVSEWKDWHGAPPLAYLIQLFTQMVVGGFSSGTLAVMIRIFDELPLHVFNIEATDAAKSILLSAVRTWWEQFDAGVALPPAYPVDALRDLLQPVAAATTIKEQAVTFDGHRVVHSGSTDALAHNTNTSYGAKAWDANGA